MKKITLNNKTYFIEISSYEQNNATAITFLSKNKYGLEPYFTLTTNIPDLKLESNEILVKTWSENSVFLDELLTSGYFLDTNKRIEVSPFATAHIWIYQI